MGCDFQRVTDHSTQITMSDSTAIRETCRFRLLLFALEN
jgi:hypothetical protein